MASMKIPQKRWSRAVDGKGGGVPIAIIMKIITSSPVEIATRIVALTPIGVGLSVLPKQFRRCSWDKSQTLPDLDMSQTTTMSLHQLKNAVFTTPKLSLMLLFDREQRSPMIAAVPKADVLPLLRQPGEGVRIPASQYDRLQDDLPASGTPCVLPNLFLAVMVGIILGPAWLCSTISSFILGYFHPLLTFLPPLIIGVFLLFSGWCFLKKQ